MFYGILIRMFFNDIERHHLPHIHAEYQGQVGTYAIPDGSLLAGELPPSKHKRLWHGLKFTRMISSLTGSLRQTAKSHFRLKGWINENCRSDSANGLDIFGGRQ